MAATDKEKKYPDWWYQSENQKELESLAGQIASRPAFEFKVDHDAMYNYYKGEYQRQGQLARIDTQAKGAALTGGYDNSYARREGDAAYTEHVDALREDVAAGLRDEALQKYTQEGDALAGQYAALLKKEKDAYELWQEDHAEEIQEWEKMDAADRFIAAHPELDGYRNHTGGYYKYAVEKALRGGSFTREEFDKLTKYYGVSTDYSLIGAMISGKDMTEKISYDGYLQDKADDVFVAAMDGNGLSVKGYTQTTEELKKAGVSDRVMQGLLTEKKWNQLRDQAIKAHETGSGVSNLAAAAYGSYIEYLRAYLAMATNMNISDDLLNTSLSLGDGVESSGNTAFDLFTIEYLNRLGGKDQSAARFQALAYADALAKQADDAESYAREVAYWSQRSDEINAKTMGGQELTDQDRALLAYMTRTYGENRADAAAHARLEASTLRKFAQYQQINAQAMHAADFAQKSVFDSNNTDYAYIYANRTSEDNYMSEEERAVYNYIYATQGAQKAKEYLDLTQSYRNEREGQARADEVEGNFLGQMWVKAQAGADQFASGIASLFNDGEVKTPSATQYASAAVDEDLEDVGPKIFGRSLGQLGGDLVQTTANLLPSIGTSALVGLVNPTAGAWAGSILMGSSAAGNGYQDMLNQGYTKDAAAAYGVMCGLSEVVLERALGGITKLGGGALPKKVIEKLAKVDGVLKKFANSTGGKILLNAGSEAVEEGLQSVLEPLFKTIVTGEEFTVDMEEALYSALMGFVTGGVFEGVPAATTAVGNKITSGIEAKKNAKAETPTDAPQQAEPVTGAGVQTEDGKGAPTTKTPGTEPATVSKAGAANSIKQQLQSSQNELGAMQAVAEIEVPSEFTGMDITGKQNWVVEKLRPTGFKVERKGFGIIHFAKKQLKAAFNYFSKGGAEEAVFEAIPHVLENGIEISSHEDHKGRNYQTVTFAAPVTVNGKRGNMAVVVKRTTDNFYKVHRILSPDGSVFELSETTSEAEPTPAGESPVTGSLATPISSASVNSIHRIGGDVNPDTQSGKSTVRISEENTPLKAASKKYGAQAAMMENAYQEGQDVERFSQEWDLAYKLGKEGVGRELLDDGETLIYLTAEQRDTAYRSGAAAAENAGIVAAAVKSLGITGENAGVLTQSFNANQITAKDYAMGLQEAYEAGKVGVPLAEVGGHAAKLTPQQRQIAYKRGQQAHGKQIAKEQATLRKNRKAQGADTSKGKVHFEGDRTKLNKTQKESLDAMEVLSKTLGVQIYVFESEVGADGKRRGANGWYDPSDGSIHIDLYAGSDGKGTMLFTVAHELTHFIKQWSPAKFQVLANILTKQYTTKGQSVAELVEAQQDKAARNGRELSREEALEEMVADSMESMLSDGSIIEIMAELKQQDKTLWQKICDWFKDLAGKLRAVVDVYKGVEPDSTEGRLVADMKDMIGTLQALYMDALVDASENFDAGAQKITTENSGGVRYQARPGQYERWEVETALWDALDHGDKGQDNLIRVGNMPQFVVDKLGISGDFYIYRNHAYENMVSEEQAKAEGRFSKKAHYHRFGIEMMAEAILALEDPILTVATKTKDGNPAVMMILPVVGNNNAPLYAMLSFYASRDINGAFDKKPHIVLTVAERAFTETGGRAGLLEIVDTAVRDGRVISFDKKKRDYLSVNTKATSLGIITEQSLNANLSQFRKEIKAFREKNNINYSVRDVGRQEAVTQALEKENAKLREDVAELRELVKLQRQVTNGTKFTKTSVEAAARFLKQSANAKGSTQELMKLLNGLYEYIASAKELTWEDVKEQAQGAVDWLWEHIDRQGKPTEYAQDILRQLHGARVYLDESQMAEAAYRFGSYDAFRKGLMGNITLAKNAEMSLDSLWAEMAEMYPDVFDGEISAADMPSALMDVIHRLRSPDTTIDYARNREMMEQELLREIYDSYWRVSTLYTPADAGARRINKLKSEHYQRMEKLKQEHREAVDRLKQEHQQRLEQVRREHRAKLEEKVSQVAKQYQDARKKNVEGRNKTEMRRRIRKKIRELSKLLAHGTKERNVKEGMKDFVSTAIASAEVLFTDEYTNEDMVRNGVECECEGWESSLIDKTRALIRQRDELLAGATAAREVENVIAGDLTGFEERMNLVRRLDGKINENMGKLKGVFARERSRLNKATASSLLNSLAEEYWKLGTADEEYIRGALDENVHQHLMNLSKEIGGTTVKDMSLSQLEQLHRAYTMVLTTVRNANKSFAENLKGSRMEQAKAVTGELAQAGKKRKKQTRGQIARAKRSWNNLKSVFAFERIGSGTLKQLYENLRSGEDTWMVDMDHAREHFLKAAKDSGYNGWDLNKQTHSFTSSTGLEFDLNLGQIMSIYAYARRGQQALDHLMKGGFVFDNHTEERVTEHGIPKTYLKDDATAYNLSLETVQEIIGKLTPEQIAFVETMQDYLSDTMGAKGNEVSMKLYGVKLFGEKHYFPLRSSGVYLSKAADQEMQKQQGQVSIKNAGFTHSTTPNAANPVVLSGFMDVWANHVNDMSMYHAFVLPMEDFNKVYNYSTPHTEEGQSGAVKQAIINAHGSAATDYINQFIRDLNGGVVADPREGQYKAWISKFKKASVMASASVVIQQPTAIVRALAYIDAKYFGAFSISRGIGRALGNKITGNHTQVYNELKKYAPVAAIKQMGRFDTDMGMGAVDYLTAKEFEGFKEQAKALFTEKGYLGKRMDEITGFMAERADEITWAQIWQAVKNEVADKQGLKFGSEEHLKAAGKRFTEVITRTQVYDSVFSRSANMRSKGAFMAMATSFMAEPTTTANMLTDAIRKAKQGDVKHFLRVSASVAGAIVFNNILRSAIYAMRDDDEDETFIEKYLQALAGGMFDDLNPMSYLPFWRDVWSLAQGYDVERADMSVIATLLDAGRGLADVLMKDTEGMTEEELEAHNKKVADRGWKVADALFSVVGLPVKNVRRDILGAVNLVDTLKADGSRKTTSNSLRDKVWEDFISSVPGAKYVADLDSRTDDLYDAIVAGDSAYVERLKSGYKSEQSYLQAKRKGLRENDGRIKAAAVARIAGDLETYMTIAKEIIAEGFFSQDDVVVAINAVINELTGGSSEASTPKAKGLFDANAFAIAVAQGDTEMAKVIQADMIRTAQRNGKTEEEARKGFISAATSSCREMFGEGELTQDQAVNALMDFCEKDEVEARASVAYWDFTMEYPDVGASAGWFETYLKKVEGSGIAIEDYVEYRNRKTGYTKRAEILKVIDGMDLTRKQKDALYRAEGYAESTLDEAPWHK